MSVLKDLRGQSMVMFTSSNMKTAKRAWWRLSGADLWVTENGALKIINIQGPELNCQILVSSLEI